MPYVVVPQTTINHKISLDDILNCTVDIRAVTRSYDTVVGTRTYWVKKIPEKVKQKYDISGLNEMLKNFCEKYDSLYKVPRSDLYTTFHIPKKTGGLREINAPCPELMTALRELKDIFELHACALYHTNAYAYIKKRRTIDALKRHQRNDSRWFMKVDFHDFFGSTTFEFILYMMSMIFPFSEMLEQNPKPLRTAVSLCMLDEGLPQGTPISPMLTNLVMIPIDHKLANSLRDFNKKSYVYTRYADDMQISSKYSFSKDEMIQYIREVLRKFDAPYTFKEEKTRYGSRSGSNWNLGLMLNKDNEITIGYKRKERFRAMVNNYILDRKNGTHWDLHDIQILGGLMSYYRSIEPDYVKGVVNSYESKYGVNVEELIKEDIS